MVDGLGPRIGFTRGCFTLKQLTKSHPNHDHTKRIMLLLMFLLVIPENCHLVCLSMVFAV